ncbi:MAG: phosphodiester glycosidase family protein [Candidatus Sericytochromatia bacterium]|nr:phosphodiester glycosidase family protein [Candidatus Sericytochromatia bacterium]
MKTFVLHLLTSQALATGVAHEAWEGPHGTIHLLRVRPAHAACVRPAVAPLGRLPLQALAKNGVAAINGGYFDPQTAAPVSWVTLDGRTASDPTRNRRLMDNPTLQPYLKPIAARTEWRALHGPTGWRWQLAPHGSETPAGWTLRHALQAGPRLLPTATLALEAFVRPGRDPINSQGRSARSGLGITGAGDLLLVMCAQGQPLADFRQSLRQLGCMEAMALDGGSSSQLAWRDHGGWHVVGAGRPDGGNRGFLPSLVSAIVVGDGGE